VFKYTSMLVSSSLSFVGTCAPNEAPAAICYARIGWGTSMPPMQLWRNASRRALLWILYKDIKDNIINLMIQGEGWGGRAVAGSGFSLPTVLAMKRGDELTRRRASVGEVEMVDWHVDLASSERERVATGGLWRDDALNRRRHPILPKEGDEGKNMGLLSQTGSSRTTGPKSFDELEPPTD
jgi:hypothetical protein